MPQPKNTNTSSEPQTGSGLYAILGAGAMVRPAGSSVPELALAGRVVELDADEGQRLLLLGAVRAADEDDLMREQRTQELQVSSLVAVSPEGAPFGGKELQSPAEHAAQEIAKAQKVAKA